MQKITNGPAVVSGHATCAWKPGKGFNFFCFFIKTSECRTTSTISGSIMSCLKVLISRGSNQWKVRTKTFSKIANKLLQQRLLRISSCARCFSQVIHSPSPPTFDSKAGFNDYEKGHAEFHPSMPKFYNFADDVINEWAKKEKSGERNRDVPGFWWVNEKGKEIKWSFEELTLNSKRVANLLTDGCDVRRRDRVMVILPRLPEWWLLNLACQRTGSVIIPGSTQLRTKDILARLLVSKATCIVADPETAKLVDEVAGLVPHLETKLIVGESMEEENRKGWLPFQKLYKQASSTHKCVPTLSDEAMTLFFTSGTTGLPKMTEHTHGSYGIGHIITGKYWLDLCPDDVHWTISDTGWAKCAYGCLFGPWNQGACVFIYNGQFEARNVLEILEKYPISTLCMPPTGYRMMVQHDLTRLSFPNLRHCLSAGEPINPEVMDEWKQATGLEIREGYGQTETTLLCGTFRCIENRPGSMGKPAPGYDVQIIDEDCNECTTGSEGDIAVRIKPHRPIGLFTEYKDDPERTTSVYRGDFYLTGDRGIRDEDGYLWFVGRADDVILSSGYRIGPFEVESALIEHSAVAESAVVSSPDPIRAEIVKAFVILSPGFQGNKDELVLELQQHVKDTTAPYKYPRKIEFVDHLPKTVSGKIKRKELRALEWDKISED